MKTFRVVVYLAGLIILLLLIWQLYGVHHGQFNETQGFNSVVIAVQHNSHQSGECGYAGIPCRVGSGLCLPVCASLG